MAAKSLNSTACLEILALTAAFETSTLLAPCAHNVSFHFPNRLLLLAAFGGSCSLLFLNSCRKNCCCCLLPFFSNICVVTAAVAWHFGSHTGTLHIEKKVAHEHEKKKFKERAKKKWNSDAIRGFSDPHWWKAWPESRPCDVARGGGGPRNAHLFYRQILTPQ